MKSPLGSFVSLFHVFDEEIRDARVKMVTGVAAGDVMVAVVIGEHHERLAGLHQCFGILHGVAEVDVVVGRAVANQELAMQLVGLAYRTAGVSGGVFLRGAHEAFRVDRVVVTPTGRRGTPAAKTGRPSLMLISVLKPP